MPHFTSSLLLCAAFACAAAAAPSPARPRPGDALFGDGRIRTFKIQVDEPALAKLKQDNRAYVPATLSEGTNVLGQVGVHLKGMGSFRPLDQKPSFAVKLDRFMPGQRYDGLGKFMLNNSSQDSTWFAEYLGTWMFRDANVPAERVTHAFVSFNGRDLGLYNLIEAQDREFVKRWFGNAEGNLYEAYIQDIDQQLDLDFGRGDQTDRKALLAACQLEDAARRWQRVDELLDVPRFVDFTLLELFACQTDGYALNRNNYRLYFPYGKKAAFVVHGLDWSYGATGTGVRPPLNSIAVRAVLSTPEGRKLYSDRLPVLASNVFRLDVMTNRLQAELDRLHSAARSDAEKKDFARGAAEMRGRLIARHQFITNQLNQPEPQPLAFAADGTAPLPKWRTQLPDGAGGKHERVMFEGRDCYHIHAQDRDTTASWRARVLLPTGKFKFIAQVRTRGVVARTDETGTGVGLRISGGKRANKLTGDASWTALEHELDIAPGGEEVDLVCELRATKGEVWFDAASLRLVKRP